MKWNRNSDANCTCEQFTFTHNRILIAKNLNRIAISNEIENDSDQREEIIKYLNLADIFKAHRKNIIKEIHKIKKISSQPPNKFHFFVTH